MAPPRNTQKVNFWSVFGLGANDSLITLKTILVNGQRFESGTKISKGELLAGVAFNERRGLDLGVIVLPDGTYEIQGFYTPNVS